MFPSDNNSDHENPLESLLFKRSSFFHHQNPNKQDDQQTPFFSNFPSPFFDEHELIMPSNQTLPHHHHHTYPVAKPEADLISNDINSAKTDSAKRALTPAPSLKLKEKAVAADHDNRDHDHHPPSKRRNLGKGKRTGKKDRHSKIRTAQGIRDRRMRLSLQIARKFFDLQDMLGYDKASSTIEWLFSKSKKAIKELMTKEANNNNLNFSASDGKSESFLSECEVVSGVEVSSNNEVVIGQNLRSNDKKPQKIARKPNNVDVRESRERARARARWRTREKMMSKLGFDVSNSSGLINNICSSNYCPNDQKLLGFGNDIQEFSGNYTSLLSQDVGTIEKLLGSSSLSSASNNLSPISDDKNNNDNNNYYYYNYQSCVDSSSNLMGFVGNWEVLGNGGDKLNSNQLTDHVTNQVSGNVINPSSSVYSAPNFPFFHQ